jgi:purine-binding chemotaxis protein CheW
LLYVKKTKEVRQFVSLRVGGGLYGFDIRIVKEITPEVSITPVPLMKPDVRGLVNIRGQVVLVLDIAAVLNESRRTLREMGQIVILKTNWEIKAVSDFKPSFDSDSIGNKPIGFIVDSVGEIATVEMARIEAAPTHVGAAHLPYIEGVVRLQEPLILLNPMKIIEIPK